MLPFDTMILLSFSNKCNLGRALWTPTSVLSNYEKQSKTPPCLEIRNSKYLVIDSGATDASSERSEVGQLRTESKGEQRNVLIENSKHSCISLRLYYLHDWESTLAISLFLHQLHFSHPGIWQEEFKIERYILVIKMKNIYLYIISVFVHKLSRYEW